jgi:hypothetical protein
MDLEIAVLQEHVTVTLHTVVTLHVGHAALTTTIILIAYVPPSPLSREKEEKEREGGRERRANMLNFLCCRLLGEFNVQWIWKL